jgi:DNA-directed RNA polymerase specialized sigma subunit
MEEKSLLLNLTGELPLFKIIDFLLENKGMDFSKSDIAEGAEISRASLFNYWNEIEKHGIVKVTRSFGKTKLYTLNNKNPVTKRIIELEKTLIAEAMNKVSSKKKEVILEN